MPDRVAYRWVDHASELELEIDAPTESGVFLAALEAFAELVADEPGPAGEMRALEVQGNDLAGLLVAWLEELAFLAENEGFVPAEATELELDVAGLRATVAGRSAEPRHLVKAVTLHRLLFAPDGDRWRARVVLDV